MQVKRPTMPLLITTEKAGVTPQSVTNANGRGHRMDRPCVDGAVELFTCTRIQPPHAVGVHVQCTYAFG